MFSANCLLLLNSCTHNIVSWIYFHLQLLKYASVSASTPSRKTAGRELRTGNMWVHVTVLIKPFLCCVSLFKLNMKFAKTWTLFSNSVNTTIRKYSLRAFIEWSLLQISLDSSGFRSFLGLVKFVFGGKRVSTVCL